MLLSRMLPPSHIAERYHRFGSGNFRAGKTGVARSFAIIRSHERECCDHDSPIFPDRARDLVVDGPTSSGCSYHYIAINRASSTWQRFSTLGRVAWWGYAIKPLDRCEARSRRHSKPLSGCEGRLKVRHHSTWVAIRSRSTASSLPIIARWIDGAARQSTIMPGRELHETLKVEAVYRWPTKPSGRHGRSFRLYRRGLQRTQLTPRSVSSRYSSRINTPSRRSNLRA